VFIEVQPHWHPDNGEIPLPLVMECLEIACHT
jgi:hypothetical protein